MDDDASVAKEGIGVGNSRKEEVEVADLEARDIESCGVYFAVLARQIPDLASRCQLGSRTSTLVGVCYVVWIEMAAGCCAIAVFGDGVDVDVVG